MRYLKIVYSKLPPGVWVACLFALLYMLWFRVASPLGDFPMNDDWAYAQSVRRLLLRGELHITDWAQAAIVFQIFWGALFARLLGGSLFVALRISTLVISFMASLACWALLRQLGVPAPAALLGALTLAANPIFLYLSYTFMSDMFYIGWMLVSLTLYAYGVRRESGWALFAGGAAAALAYLSRQLGVMLPLAACAVLLWRDRRLNWRALALAALLPLGVVAVHSWWLYFVHGVPWVIGLNAVQGSLAEMLSPAAPVLLGVRFFTGLLYLGVFALPVFLAQCLSFPAGGSDRRRLLKLYGVWLVALATAMAGALLLIRQPMPFLVNTITRDGLGAPLLAGQRLPLTPEWVFWLVTLCAPFAAAAQGALWTEALWRARREGPHAGTVLVIATLLMMAMTAVIVFMWDEYLLPFLPAALYLALRRVPIRPLGFAAGVLACAAMIAYGTIEMSETMATYGATWQAARELVAQGAAPEVINAGYEWVGWYEFESALPAAIAAGKGNDVFGWMTMTPDRYLLAFEPLPGWHTLKRVPYRTLVRSADRYVYVLEKDAAWPR